VGINLAGDPRRQEQHDNRQQCLPLVGERPTSKEQDRSPDKEHLDRDSGLSGMREEERALTWRSARLGVQENRITFPNY